MGSYRWQHAQTQRLGPPGEPLYTCWCWLYSDSFGLWTYDIHRQFQALISISCVVFMACPSAEVSITCICVLQRKQDSKAQAPRFPKAKDEGWFLVIGEVDQRALLAVKRIGYVRSRTAVSVAFYTPEKTGK